MKYTGWAAKIGDGRAVVMDGPNRVCTVSPLYAKRARLIAAAPEMLKALTAAVPYLPEGEYAHKITIEAIRKATGEPDEGRDHGSIR